MKRKIKEKHGENQVHSYTAFAHGVIAETARQMGLKQPTVKVRLIKTSHRAHRETWAIALQIHNNIHSHYARGVIAEAARRMGINPNTIQLRLMNKFHVEFAPTLRMVRKVQHERENMNAA